MRILFGMPSTGSWGGVIACEPPVAKALRTAGEHVQDEVYVYGDKDERNVSTAARVRRVISTGLRFRKVIRNGNFDIVHLNTAFDRRSVLRDAASIFLIGRTRAKYFLKVHGASYEQFNKRSMLFNGLIRYIASRVHGLGVHTEEEMSALERLGFDRTQFHAMLNAVVVSDNKPAGFVRVHKRPTECFRLLYAGRFIEAKGVLETIRACALLKDRRIRFVLECLGDGPLESAAHELVKELGLREVVNFRGHLPADELDRLFYETDIFVFPTSHPEGFPIVLFNAVAAGMPIVTTKRRAANDYLSEPENCLFSANDPDDVASRLEELIGDVELRTRMSENNIAFGEGLTPEKMAADYLRIYRRVVAK